MTPPTFYEVCVLINKKPHPSGCRRFTPTLSRLRLGLALFKRIALISHYYPPTQKQVLNKSAQTPLPEPYQSLSV